VTTPLATLYRCTGCGWTAPADELLPFRCRRRGEGGDHVLARTWADELIAPAANRWLEEALADDHPNPFVRFRKAFHSWHFARAHGMDDSRYVELVLELDRRVTRVDGKGFSVTPFRRHEGWPQAASRHWIKDETGGVAGSHKARHLMGIAVWIETLQSLGLFPRDHPPPLAIASCGNAALAAAVVAAAMGHELRVFVPEEADPAVVRRIQELGAQVQICPREDKAAGDPTVRAFHREVERGALPFGCQGPDNGMTLEGGLTLGYEMAQTLRAEASAATFPRHVVVQVGGGALGSSVFQSLMEALPCTHPPGDARVEWPRLHTVQTRGGWPLRRAWEIFVRRLLAREGRDPGSAIEDDAQAARWMAAEEMRPVVLEELARAATAPEEFMWPWEIAPRSVATGILDDETYDWRALLFAMVLSGGIPVVTDEDTLRRARDLAREETAIPVSATGSAGLAGWLTLQEQGVVEAPESVALLFTGIARD